MREIERRGEGEGDREREGEKERCTSWELVNEKGLVAADADQFIVAHRDECHR
jgi:hypothetical protein